MLYVSIAWDTYYHTRYTNSISYSYSELMEHLYMLYVLTDLAEQYKKQIKDVKKKSRNDFF